MTPADNRENRGSGTTSAASPPWQRVDKDTNGHEHSPVGFPVDEPDEADPVGQQTVVTGTAARNLFNGTPPTVDRPRAEPEREAPSRPRTNTSAARRSGRGPRRASLQIKRFDPWSVLKLSLVLGVAMFFVWMVAVGLLYTVLDGMGVWDKLNGTYSSLVSGDGGAAPTDPLISAARVFSIAAIIGAINIVLVSALATIMAFIYNVSADLAGGLEVTLSERE